MKLSDLKLNPNNPQKFSGLSKLENSIKEFPKMMELRPLVYDPDDENIVLGGNKRLVCLQNMGYEEIPDNWAVSAKKLTEEEKRRFIVADNVGFGEWDEDVLIEFYSKDELEDWGCEFEFKTDEIKEEKEQNYIQRFELVIECDGENTQEKLFNEFTERGFKCRILTL